MDFRDIIPSRFRLEQAYGSFRSAETEGKRGNKLRTVMKIYGGSERNWEEGKELEDWEEDSLQEAVRKRKERREKTRDFEGTKREETVLGKVIGDDFSTSLRTWKLAHCLSSSTPVFTVSGEYPDVISSLTSRGWVLNPNDSSFHCDLMWRRAAKPPPNLHENHLFNHFKAIFHLSTKISFTLHVRCLPDICGISPDTFYPRAFPVRIDSEFEQEFKSSFAQSILKRFMIDPTSIPLPKVRLSLQICQSKQSPRQLSSDRITENQWKLLKSTTENTISRYSAYCGVASGLGIEELSHEIKALFLFGKERNPQFFIDGVLNLWIVKPGRKSRGRDIFLSDNLEEIRRKCSLSQCWIAQKYIETPLLIQSRKFDIRQWVLVTSVQPLTIWFYSDCYLRFAAENYSLRDKEDLYVHLTNNSITKHSELYETAEIPGLMWHSGKFREHLRNVYHRDVWIDEIQPKMKEIAIFALKSTEKYIKNRPKSFELLGFDYMIDERLVPWLLEVNVSPAMDYSTQVTEVLVKEVLEDTIKVVVDYPVALDKQGADTGKFLLIY